MQTRFTLIAISAALLAACTTVPQAPPAPIVIAPQVVKTCQPVSALVRVVVPAETKIQFAITQIENPPYEPIESRVKQTRIVKQAQVIYVDSNGREIIDICEPVERGPTGPAAGEVLR